MRLLDLETFADLDRLGPEWDSLFEAGPDAQSSRAWFATSAAAALPPEAAACFVAIHRRGIPLAIIPLRTDPADRWTSLTTPYTCLFQPLLAPELDADAILEVALRFGTFARQRPLLVLEAMDEGWPALPAFRSGLEQAGLRTRTFAHFGNWWEAVPNSWTGYLQGRPGQLRETIRRKTRAAERDASLRLEFARTPDALNAALDAYEAVYARSWKQPEPHPGFNQALVAGLSRQDILRFGVMWAGEQPIAAQYWTVWRKRATVLKLAHDDAWRTVSPGTVLTAFTIRGLIEADHVAALDFGRGDDPYKQGWAKCRRQRVGLLAFDPWRARGLAAMLRHDAGHLLRAGRNLLHRSGR